MHLASGRELRAVPRVFRPSGRGEDDGTPWFSNVTADMTDTIEIRDLLLRTIIGVNADERINRQDVLINIWLTTDTRPAARSDDIRDAVNYRTIAKKIIELVEGSQFQLVERLAEEVAALCLRDDRIARVRVSVHKPTALRFAASVGVTIERSRNSDPAAR